MAHASHASAGGLRVVRASGAFAGEQGNIYEPAVSAEAVGSKALHMQIVHIPPGSVARAHKHEAHETAIYVLSGESGVWYGDNLEHHETAVAGEFCYIAAGVPHMPYNISDTDDCVAIIARTDPNEQESVVLLPELEAARLQSGDVRRKLPEAAE